MIPERLRYLADSTVEIAERFKSADKNLYLVGGVVRDALMGELSVDADLDFTTDATPDQVEELVGGWADAVWTQGKRFGTIGLTKNRQVLEITTHRGEFYSPDSRKPRVEFSTDIEADLSRRDFTVNAMALKLPEMTLFDPFDGAADLASKRLRTPLDPKVSFTDDPLRMMRAARFIARFDLVPEGDLVSAIDELKDRLSIVSAERVRDELNKLLLVERPTNGLWFLVKTGLADLFLPELPALELEQDPIHHHKDVLAHTIAVVEKASPELILRLAALMHDIGKPRTREITPNGVSFHHHDVVGARMTKARMKELRYPSDDIDAVARLVELHLRFHTYSMGWTDSAIRRYVRDAGPLLGRLNELTRCDCTTRNKAKAIRLSKRMDELEEKIEDLAKREELEAMRPEIDGEAVMKHLKIGPGREVGLALKFLLAVRLDEGILGEDEIYKRLDDWWALQTHSN